ncbi:hypothetical protein [Streptomyces sp. NPDC005760]|uniref:hypothetical protein n=1 Tax=Streptomyces sp. NPDC005760 TaxID=3156718 RepID=UPI0033E4BB03
MADPARRGRSVRRGHPLAAATAATELLALDLPEGHPAPAVLKRQLGAPWPG